MDTGISITITANHPTHMLEKLRLLVLDYEAVVEAQVARQAPNQAPKQEPIYGTSLRELMDQIAERGGLENTGIRVTRGLFRVDFDGAK